MQVLLQVVKVDLLISLLKLYHIQHWEQDINQGNDKSKKGYIQLSRVCNPISQNFAIQHPFIVLH